MTTKKFVCKLCGYDTDIKFCLISHLQKKKICSNTSSYSREEQIKELTEKEYNEVTYNCNYCQKKFNDRSNRTKHHKICKKAPSNITTDADQLLRESNHDDSKLDITTAELRQMRQEMQDMRKTIGELTTQLKRSPYTQQMVINNNLNAQTVNITLNNYGNENLTHLTPEFLSHCLLNPKKGLPTLIETIHYNKDIPENHNIRFKSWKKNLLEKCIDSQWRECDASNTLDELIRKGYRILNTHYVENFMNDPAIYEDEMKQRMYERFRFLSDTTCNEYNAVKRELRVLIKDRTMYFLLSPESNTQTDTESPL